MNAIVITFCIGIVGVIGIAMWWCLAPADEPWYDE